MTKKNCGLKLTLTILATISLFTCIIGCVVPVGSQVGDNAPDFTLSTLDGGQVTLSELQGKPVMLIFWTTGCYACIFQMSSLEEAYETLGDDVEFINIDIGESNYRVRQTVDSYGFSLPVALDSDESVTTAYNIGPTPTNIIIDKDGVIHHIRKGAFLNTDEILEIFSDLE
ncbi:MAG: redoxin domain-containing protein [Dehalococcoidia bacterium]|jgi:peroxiredoxin